jgi:hypothetical protein
METPHKRGCTHCPRATGQELRVAERHCAREAIQGSRQHSHGYVDTDDPKTMVNQRGGDDPGSGPDVNDG